MNTALRKYPILFILAAILLLFCSCQTKMGINSIIGDAEFVVARVYDDTSVYEITITDTNDVNALKDACHVLGEYEDGGYDHRTVELIFAGKEREIVLYPSYESSDYILTDSGIFYRTGLDRRVDLILTLQKYDIFLQ